MKKIGIGCIGCGFVANEIHLPTYLSSPKAQLIAVADINEQRARDTAAKYNIKKIFTDYNDLLNDESTEAVSICVPTHLHSKVTTDAAEAGKHILCEKPIARTIEEAKNMINVAEKNDVKLMIGYPLRFLPNHLLAKKMISRGKIGKTYFIRAQSASPGPYGTPGLASGFYFDPNKGGGALLDIGSHLADLLIWMFGEINEVKASIGTYKPEINDADDVASVSLKFRNGIIGQMFVSWVNIQNWNIMTNFNNIQILGEKGTVDSDLWGPSVYYYSDQSLMCKLRGRLKLTPSNLDPNIPFMAKNYAYGKEIDSFLDSIIEDKKPEISGEDGLKALNVLLEAINTA